MSRIPYLSSLLRKRLDRVRRQEPARLDVVLLPQIQESIDPDCRAEDASRHISAACWSAGLSIYPAPIFQFTVGKFCIRWKSHLPSTHGVDIDAVAYKHLLGHD